MMACLNTGCLNRAALFLCDPAFILKSAYYLPEEYEMLREFFNLVVKKHNEQIVFKKKK